MISVLHKRVQCDRYRFTAVDKIEEDWSRVIVLLTAHPNWVRVTTYIHPS